MEVVAVVVVGGGVGVGRGGVGTRIAAAAVVVVGNSRSAGDSHSDSDVTFSDGIFCYASLQHLAMYGCSVVVWVFGAFKPKTREHPAHSQIEGLLSGQSRPLAEPMHRSSI